MRHKNTLVSVIMLVVMFFGLVPAPQPVYAATTCDWAQFVADVTIPDGTTFTGGTAFAKTWRLKNIGTCTWTTDYSIAFVDGTQMGSTSSVKLGSSVAPGNTIDVSVNLTAPSAAGTYRGNWRMKNAGGVLFGIGPYANGSYWVEIRVGSGDSGGTGYDFVANAGSAVWSSGAGTLSFPGTDGSASGFGMSVASPKLENGTTDTAPGLLMAPQDVYYGYIQAKYPSFKVQSGDHFQSIFNCEYNATNCFVNFRINYQIGSGAVLTFKSFNERYEGQYYRADYDLSSLAGQDVSFILYIGAAGYGTGDRALWGAPRITRGGVVVTNTPVPTAGPSPTVVSGGTDKVSFVADVTIPDGSILAPNTPFKKTWRIKNIGSSTWTNKYSLVFVSGNKMNGPDSQLLTSTVGPNTTFDISVDLTSPAATGTYRGYWMLKNDKGATFGIGALYDKAWWVDISVTGGVTPVPTNTPVVTPVPTTGTTVFDFTTDPAAATWMGSGGGLSFPGTEGNINGFAIKNPAIKMENGVTQTSAALLMVPQDATDGSIQGIYPAFAVLSGDRFKATIGCEFDATTCDVYYRLDYKKGDGTVVSNFWVFHEKYEGYLYNVNIDLSSLAGQNVQFILTVLANGSASGDRAVWVAPRITR